MNPQPPRLASQHLLVALSRLARLQGQSLDPVELDGLKAMAGDQIVLSCNGPTTPAVLTLAVVEGAAMGGGCGLAAACDLVLAADSAQLAMPEVTLGLPPAQIAPFVAERIGERAALRLMATGQRIGAVEAARIGLVDEVVPVAELDAALKRWAEQLQRAEPQALRATRSILRHSATESLGDKLDFAAQCFARSLRSGTASEGLAALAAKRPPGWATPT